MVERRTWLWGAGIPVILLALALACGDGSPVVPDPLGTGPDPIAQTDGGTAQGDGGGSPDGGPPASDAGDDAGVPADGGVDAGEAIDAGEPTTDAGVPGHTFTEVNASPGDWIFHGPEAGLPTDVYGASEDQGGNLWVAGGREGLFLLRKGATRFERFGLAEGLTPYGMWKGKIPVGEKLLDVRSVQGGPPGVAWVGYQGKPNCEAEFYKAPGELEDPNVFKSGDADRVELQADGTLRVVHYDLHSPAHTVPGYGHREKICSVYRIVWDQARGAVWFGSNHGFSWGEATYQGVPGECQDPALRAANAWIHTDPAGVTETRQRCQNGVMEHMHPAIYSPPSTPTGAPSLIAGDARGVAVDPSTGDVWVGTAIRTTIFRIMTNAAARPGFVKDPFVKDGAPWDFEAARKLSADKNKWANRFDVWTDAISEPNALYTPADRKDDQVSGLVVLSDGTVWVSSEVWGLAQLDSHGAVLRRLFEGTSDGPLGALARDTRDESLWLGHLGKGGLSRIQGDSLIRYSPALERMRSQPVWDVQTAGTGPGRRVIAAFRSAGGRPGGVGIYTGD